MKIALILLLLSGVPSSWEEAALRLSSAGSLEELQEDVMEMYSYFHEHPLDINNASEVKLRSSGLFSVFQARSIVEYRRESGDILSYVELGLVPGFRPEEAGALRFFTALKTARPPGQRENRRIRHSLTLKGSARYGTGVAGGLKYSGEFGERAALMWSSRTTLEDSRFRPGTISAVWYGKRLPGKVIAGDFAARFGQGLAQWSGFSLSGLNSIQAFRKNATGLSPTGAFGSTLKGLAADFRFAGITASAAISQTPMANLNWTGRNATAGITGRFDPEDRSLTASADFHAGLPGISLFGEFASKFDGSCNPAAIAGAIWKPSYENGFALLCRYFSPGFKSDWSGAALCYEGSWAKASGEISFNTAKSAHQYKALLELAPTLERGDIVLNPSLRANWRLRPESSPPSRLDLRADIKASRGKWSLNGRYNILWSRARAWLWYAEPGFKDENASLYLRFTLFCIDNWDDRIYVYERDAPGSFNVPAYYGRGYALSAVSALKIQGKKLRSKFNLRLSLVSYKWNPTPKDTRLEAGLQYSADF